MDKELEQSLKKHLIRTFETEFQIEVLLEMMFAHMSNYDAEKKEYLIKDYQTKLKLRLENAPQNYKDLLRSVG